MLFKIVIRTALGLALVVVDLLWVVFAVI